MIDENFQDMVLACMQRIPEFNSVACHHLEPEYFDGAVRKNLAKMMIDFWMTYDSLVSDRVVVSLLSDLVDSGRMNKTDVLPHGRKFKMLRDVGITEWKYVLDKLIDFIKHQKIKSLIEDSVKRHLPKGNYSEIERSMAQISSISSANRVHAYDYFDEGSIAERTEERERELTEGKMSISTGIPEMDEKMHAGGYYKKELYIYAAPPKRGKTMKLLYASNQAALQGYNVAHFTCEVSREVCAKRLDAMNSKTRIHDVVSQHEAVAAHITSKRPRGRLMIFEYPTKSLTTQMIDSQVDKLRTEQDVVVDMIVVDYLDILRYQGPHGDSSWSAQGPIAEDLRGLGGKYGVPVVTATQINRQGAGKAVTGGSDVAGNYEKIMIADEIYTISATDEELKEGVVRINNSESRNSESGTIVINTNFGYGQFYASTVGTEL